MGRCKIFGWCEGPECVASGKCVGEALESRADRLDLEAANVRNEVQRLKVEKLEKYGIPEHELIDQLIDLLEIVAAGRSGCYGDVYMLRVPRVSKVLVDVLLQNLKDRRRKADQGLPGSANA